MLAPYAEELGRGASEPVVEMIKELVEKGKPIPPILYTADSLKVA